MYLRPLAVILALAACASAENECLVLRDCLSILPAVVNKINCAMEGVVPALLQNRFLYSIGSLTEPTQNSESEASGGGYGVLASGIVANKEVANQIWWGFENRFLETWLQEGRMDIPDEYEGHTDLNSRVYMRTSEDHHKEYFYADAQFQPIDPPFFSSSDPYDPTVRYWYVASVVEDVGVWNHPYIGKASTGDIYIVASVNLQDETGELLGVTSLSLPLLLIDDVLEAAAEQAADGTVLYIADSSEDHLLIASSEPVDAAYDAESNLQIPALESPSMAIAGATQAIMDHVANGGDPALVFVAMDPEGQPWFVQEQAVGQVGTLPFEGGLSWNYVVTQPAVCDEGHMLDVERAECVCSAKRPIAGGTRAMDPAEFAPGTDGFELAQEAAVLVNSEMLGAGGACFGLDHVISMSEQVVSGMKYTVRVQLRESDCTDCTVAQNSLAESQNCNLLENGETAVWDVEFVHQAWLTPAYTLVSATLCTDNCGI